MRRSAFPSRLVEARIFSSQRMLSLVSIGTRVWLTLRLSASSPLNWGRVQNRTAVSPSGNPSSVIGKRRHEPTLRA